MTGRNPPLGSQYSPKVPQDTDSAVECSCPIAVARLCVGSAWTAVTTPPDAEQLQGQTVLFFFAAKVGAKHVR